MSATTSQLMTADELLKLPRGRLRYELVNGELRQMSPAGHNHGRIAARLTGALVRYVEEHELGEVYAAETGFLLRREPDTVLAPGVAYVARERADAVGESRGYFPSAPELAVEVLSPSDTVRETEEKVSAWLEYGTKLIWVVSPKLRHVTVYRSLTDIEVLTENDSLDGERVVPGFSYPVNALFGKRS
ncbi:MAG TPA: Uma2 family endonuclease [Pyrinomonadaceae bacterium]|nr:Uma2 family endonuclease [Pyrinomonadaceae bacterium]